ncbi:MAG: 30S ribosomal protein S15 [Candidatus Magasanikbacteria bacterium CG10_big_fil_rev_8_21_14_0_10_40_10]|uniref:Small ribosomal subunit protein uS15 n=1 Tax=Candidatus Magasanikbacteria bacterium CG10_big_fil_rev_8_21_14_0_10_40_10 TaxID=1974648 RepID=A0A2M6W2L1_9BACT|nr:MAG: 30S ribosomal protein S15 [Candidatus Magasanikbacteria bacterium CG10_big_fil_rev_8_21_14_0_10_40_10]
MLDTKKKQKLIKKYQTHEGDTGSSQVQIAILTAEIQEIVDHLKNHFKDHSSRRGLLRKVSARRNLMRYLKKEDPEGYDELIKKLKIKKSRKIDKEDRPAELEDEAVEDLIVEDEDEK